MKNLIFKIKFIKVVKPNIINTEFLKNMKFEIKSNKNKIKILNCDVYYSFKRIEFFKI